VSPPLATPPRPADLNATLRRGELWGLAAGGLPYALGANSPKQLAAPVFNILLGVSPLWIGVVLMLARIADALFDPLVGVLSDNARGPGGRRKPYLLAGSLLSALVFPFIWWVPAGSSPTAAALWFGTTLLGFYAVFTVFAVPYLALVMESTPDYAERTQVNALRAWFGAWASVITMWTFRFAQSDVFPDVTTGLHVMGVVLGGCFLVGLLPLRGRERYQRLAVQQPRETLRSAIAATWSNAAFRRLIALTLVFVFGTFTVQVLGVYVNTYYVCGGSLAAATTLAGLHTTLNVAAVALLIQPLTGATRRWGKERTLMGCLVLGSAGAVAKWFLFDPRWPYAQLVLPFVTAPVDTGFWLLTQAMKADIADWDEYQTGIRREGAYAALSSWVQQLSVALTASLGGALLVLVGFEQSRGVDQPAGTLSAMRVLFSALPLAAYITVFFLLRAYPLTQERMHRVRASLEARRAPV
jgi:GPH family glycoside/pentoside/hexuronide:cation symporter